MTPGLQIVPAANGQHTCLELQGGRDAIERPHPIGERVLPVRVPVDESRGNDEPPGIHDQFAFDRRLGDVRDPAILDADVPNRVEFRLGIDDPPIGEDNVVGRCRGGILSPEKGWQAE